MSEPKQPVILIFTATPTELKKMTPHRAFMLARSVIEAASYRAAMTIVVPQIVIAFIMLSCGIGAHGVLLGILAAGFLNAIIRLLIWWLTRRAAAS